VLNYKTYLPQNPFLEKRGKFLGKKARKKRRREKKKDKIIAHNYSAINRSARRKFFFASEKKSAERFMRKTFEILMSIHFPA
jgi:hypothetical protein